MPRKLAALARSTHPGPALAVTFIAVVLGIGAGLGAGRVILAGCVILASQLSVGLSNDWIDAERDRSVGRTDKPVALGAIDVAVVRAIAWASAGLSIVLAIPLGVGAALVDALTIASAWSYNAILKRTPFSVVPYIVSFGLLPSIVTLSRVDPRWAQPWAFGVGALLGVAAHFANVLPDLEDDSATGVRGLPHRLGRRFVSIATYCVLVAAAALEFLGAGGSSFLPGLVGLGASAVIAVTGVSISARPTRWHFRLIIAAAIIDVIVLAAAGSQLVA